MNMMWRGCSCGCNPCRCDDWCQDWCDPCANLSADQRACLKQLLREVINEGTGLIGPIHGVTDGSNAAPGDVGEFLSFTGTFAYQGSPNFSVGTISLAVIPPGDWDLTVSASAGLNEGMSFNVQPIPTGLSNGMAGASAIFSTSGGGQGAENIVLIGQAARGSFSIPTLLPFSVSVNMVGTTGLPAGSMLMRLEARRAR